MHMTETNDQPQEQPTPEDNRRDALRRLGTYTLYTAPVLLAVLASTKKAQASPSP